MTEVRYSSIWYFVFTIKTATKLDLFDYRSPNAIYQPKFVPRAKQSFSTDIYVIWHVARLYETNPSPHKPLMLDLIVGSTSYESKVHFNFIVTKLIHISIFDDVMLFRLDIYSILLNSGYPDRRCPVQIIILFLIFDFISNP